MIFNVSWKRIWAECEFRDSKNFTKCFYNIITIILKKIIQSRTTRSGFLFFSHLVGTKPVTFLIVLGSFLFGANCFIRHYGEKRSVNCPVIGRWKTGMKKSFSFNQSFTTKAPSSQLFIALHRKFRKFQHFPILKFEKKSFYVLFFHNTNLSVKAHFKFWKKDEKLEIIFSDFRH